MQETWIRFLGLEDPLEKEMATHPSILAWRIPWIQEPGRLQSMGSSYDRVGHDWAHTRACVLSGFSRVQLFATLWTVSRQVSLSIRFSRQEHWTGLPCPPPGNLPNPGIEPAPNHAFCAPALQADSLPAEPLGKPLLLLFTYSLIFHSTLYRTLVEFTFRLLPWFISLITFASHIVLVSSAF